MELFEWGVRYMVLIKIDYKLDNWNETIAYNRANKYVGAREKKREMNIVRLFLLNTPKITKYPIRLNCIWHTTNLRGDLDNKSLKSVLDAMQKYGIIENDNIKHIPEINHKAIKDEKDYLEIYIEEI